MQWLGQTFCRRYSLGQRYIVRMLWRNFYKIFRGGGNFAGTRIRVFGRIVTYVSAIVGRINGDFACEHAVAGRGQEQRQQEAT